MSPCPDYWDTHGGYCYKYYDDYMTFDEASSKCGENGAFVTSIDSEEANAFIFQDIGEKH